MPGSNRLLVLIAVFLVGLLVLGLLAIGGIVAFDSFNQTQQSVKDSATSTPPAVSQLPTATNTRAPSPTPVPTRTPRPKPTNTPAVRETITSPEGDAEGGDMGSQAVEGGPASQSPTPGSSPVPGATPAASQESTPNTGIGGLEIVLIAIGLVGVLFITRRLRTHG
jgi:lysozyme family protein